jgi:DNA-binding PadR family transcriptional regulator
MLMKVLSQREEHVMLAVWALKDDAYLVAIKKYLSSILGKNWTLGAIHTPLRNLEHLGYLESRLGEATAIRGGRAKRIYRITKSGLEVLTKYKKITEALWSDFPGFNFRSAETHGI